jgi:hypothetical protein
MKIEYFKEVIITVTHPTLGAFMGTPAKLKENDLYRLKDAFQRGIALQIPNLSFGNKGFVIIPSNVLKESVAQFTIHREWVEVDGEEVEIESDTEDEIVVTTTTYTYASEEDKPDQNKKSK